MDILVVMFECVLIFRLDEICFLFKERFIWLLKFFRELLCVIEKLKFFIFLKGVWRVKEVVNFGLVVIIIFVL